MAFSSPSKAYSPQEHVVHWKLKNPPGALAQTRTICIAAVPWLNDNRGPEIVGAVSTLTVLATIAVGLRFLARSFSGSKYGWDDWLILFALVWEFGLSTIQLLAVHYGLGRHILMVDVDNVTKFGKLFFATTLVFPVACAALKFSVLVFYHRIFPIRKFTQWSIAIGIIIVAWFIAFIISQFLSCWPLQFWWDKSIPGGHCVNLNHIAYYVTSPPDILTNIAILVLPIPWLWGLQLETRRKFALTFIFFLGSFAALGSIIRIPFLHQLKVADVSYTIVNSAIWLNVEIAIGILSASLPLMRPLVSRAFPSQLRSRLTGSRTTGSQRIQDLSAKGKLSGSRNGKHSHTKGLSDSGIYAGQGRKQPHKSWYNNIAVAKSSKGTMDRGSEGGSEEDMVPMGKIQVRHDVEWEQEQHPGTTKDSETSVNFR
ncbi:MAG: hypothetical protein Q9223_001404 [Gallowayella weberi]